MEDAAHFSCTFHTSLDGPKPTVDGPAKSKSPVDRW